MPKSKYRVNPPNRLVLTVDSQDGLSNYALFKRVSSLVNFNMFWQLGIGAGFCALYAKKVIPGKAAAFSSAVPVLWNIWKIFSLLSSKHEDDGIEFFRENNGKLNEYYHQLSVYTAFASPVAGQQANAVSETPASGLAGGKRVSFGHPSVLEFSISNSGAFDSEATPTKSILRSPA